MERLSPDLDLNTDESNHHESGYVNSLRNKERIIYKYNIQQLLNIANIMN